MFVKSRHIKKGLKVAIIHDFFQYLGGGEKVLLSISELFPEADLFFLASKKELVKKYFPKQKIENSFLQKLPGIFSGFGKLLYLGLIPAAVESFDLRDYDLVISTHTFAKGVVTDEMSKHISYIHSPTRYLWDYRDKYLDEWKKFGGIAKFFVQRKFSKLRTWDQISAQRPDILLANSKVVQSRITKYYNRKSKILYPPVDVNSIKVNKNNEDYFLIVSNLKKFKRVDIAVETFKDSKKHLIIIGDGPERKNLENRSSENIEFLGFVPKEDLSLYFVDTKAVIICSEEDFGIVQIEAMAAGKPVIAYGKGGSLETIIDGESGVFFDEQNVKSLKKALTRFKKIEKAFNPERIRANSERYSKEKFQALFRKEINMILKK